jgi:probable phosphoglycerate mutase
MSVTAGEPDLVLIFDGGAIGNPGDGYGSYVVFGRDRTPATPVRLTYPGRTTNNQAEYMTLIEALRAILADASSRGKDPTQASIRVLSDSKLVVEQVNGRWKIKNADLRPLAVEAAALLRRFGRWSLEWHSRTRSVHYLGH